MERAMNRQWIYSTPGPALLAAVFTLLTLLPAGASAQSLELQGAQMINVNVSFNTYLPLADLSETGLAESQRAGRSLVYKLAQDECANLKASIAQTCQLTHVNVSTQVQPPQYGTPVQLYLNGDAGFAVTLKAEPVQ